MLVDYNDFAKVLLAILIGVLIGGEREFRDKAAGIRTNIFICVGSTLFTIFSIKIAGNYNDATRIASNIVSGIGFLGAGVIMRDRGRITGLTTASTIWVVAALGMGIGAGDLLFTCTAAAIILIILIIFPIFDKFLGNFRETKTYKILCAAQDEQAIDIQKAISDSKLIVRNFKKERRENEIHFSWEAYGSPKKHQKISEVLINNSKIREFYN